ncbi:hypothetical protein AgCh_008591 [Apium graveolens]
MQNPPQPEPNLRNPQNRHVVDMIIGESIPYHEVMHPEAPLQAFHLTCTIISFSYADYPTSYIYRNGLLIVTLNIANQDVRKFLIDNGSSVDIIFRHTLRRMILNCPFEAMKFEDIQGPLYGFGNYTIRVYGTTDIPTTFGTSPHNVPTMVKYYIIDIASPYNAFISQPTLFFLGEIISSHQAKFPIAMVSWELITDPINFRLLREFSNIFAWKPEDMPGLDESIATHELHIDPNKAMIKLKRRIFSPERQQTIDEEISKLLKANFIYEIHFPEWISDVVLVKISSGKW